MKTAYLFPGQGSQSASGLELVRAEAPDLLACCVDLIGEEPFTRCDESTRFAQPAIVLTSLAACAVWRVWPLGSCTWHHHLLRALVTRERRLCCAA